MRKKDVDSMDDNRALTYICPACNAYLRYDGKQDKWCCDYCESSFTLAELEQRGAKVKDDDYEVQQYADKAKNESKVEYHYEENVEQGDTDFSEMQGFICPSCGAEIATDSVTAATFCVFCGNPTVLPKQLSGQYRPSGVIPFKTDKKDAQKAFLDFCKGKKLLPKGYTDEQRVEKITGVYVPFWVFDCKADFDYHATGENTTTWSDSDFVYTKHDLYHIHRNGKMDFENIPLDASEKMQDDMMDALEPFLFADKRAFNMSYLSGFLAEKYSYEPKELYDRMTKRITEGVENKAGENIPYDSVFGVQCHTEFTSDKQEYVMLPVWMLVSKYKGEDYLFAMNGQTGKIVGSLPCSTGRTVFHFVIAFLIFFIIAFVIGGVFL